MSRPPGHSQLSMPPNHNHTPRPTSQRHMRADSREASKISPHFKQTHPSFKSWAMAMLAYLVKNMPDFSWVLNIQKHDSNTDADVSRAVAVRDKYITQSLKELDIAAADSTEGRRAIIDAKNDAQYNVSVLMFAHIDTQFHYIFDAIKTTDPDAATKIWIIMHKWWNSVSKAKHAHLLVQGISSIQATNANIHAVLAALPSLLDKAKDVGTITMDASELFTLLLCAHILKHANAADPALAALAREFMDSPDIHLRAFTDKLHHLHETMGTPSQQRHTRRALPAPHMRPVTQDDLDGRYIDGVGDVRCSACKKICGGNHRATTCRGGAPPGTPPVTQQRPPTTPATPPPRATHTRPIAANTTTATDFEAGWFSRSTGEFLSVNDSVNTDSSYSTRVTRLPVSNRTATAPPTLHRQPATPASPAHRRPCIDSAAGKSVTNDAHNVTHTTPCPLIIRSSSGHMSHNNLLGTWHIHTTDEHSSPLTLSIPDTVLSPGTKASLLSLHHLLTLGYSFLPHLTDQSWLVTPTGDRIPLHLESGLWYLPPPPIPKSRLPPSPLPTTMGGRFHALLSATDQEVSPDPLPPNPTHHARALALHRAHAHPYNGKLILALQRKGDVDPDILTALRTLRCSDCAMMKAHRLPASRNKPRRGVRFLLHPDNPPDPSPTSSRDSGTNLHDSVNPTLHLSSHSPSHGTQSTTASGPHPLVSITGTVVQARPVSQAPSKYLPGEFLHIDSTGKYDFDTTTHDGSTHAFVLTDDASSGRFGFPVKDKTSKTLISLLQLYQAESGIPLRRIQTDMEFITEDLKEYCRSQPNPIQLHASPAFEHESNGRSEATVNHSKATARVLCQTAGAGPHLFPYALSYGLIQHNALPSDANPDRLSPLDIWPSMPFQHTRLTQQPFGCRCFLHEGKDHGQNNTKGYRGRPLIFLGFDNDTSSYLAYDIDSSGTLHHGTHMHFHANIFPLKEMMLAGEAFSSDQAINIHGWRAPAPLPITEVSDIDLATFCSGKQICLPLPPHYWPAFAPHSWTVTCIRPIQHRNGTTSIETTSTGFSGPAHLIPPKWRNFRNKPFLETYPVSPPHTHSSQRDRSLRTALLAAYPTAQTLSDLATQSANAAGKLPTHPAVAQHTIQGEHNISTPKPPPTAATHPNPRPTTTSPNPHNTHNPPQRPTSQTKTKTSTHPSRSSPRIKRTPVPARLTSTHRISHAKRCPPNTGTHFIRTYILGFEPQNQRAAQRHTTWPLWQTAEQREVQGILDRGTVERVHRSSLPPNTEILPTMFTYKDKDTGPKARLVILGNKLKNKPSCSDTFASTPHPASVRTLFALAAQSGHDVHQLDISQAFCQSDDLKSHLRTYIRPPPAYESDPNIVWRLIKPLYGLSIAPKAWQCTLRSYLTSTGWKSVGFEDTFYTRSTGTTTMHLIYHVDDILLSFDEHDSHEAQTFKTDLLKRFAGLDLGPVKRYLGVDIFRNSDGSIHLSQERLINDLLDRHLPPNSNPVKTPIDHNTAQDLDQAPTEPTANKDIYQKYNEIVGSLRYICEWTRGDLSFSAHVLARSLSNPGLAHLEAAIRTLRYLKGTSSLTLKFSPQQDPSLQNTLVGFADADYAAHKQTRKSITAWTFFLNGGAISWRCKLQPSVAVSTSEAEFVSASKAALEAVWLRRILADLGIPQPQPTPMYEDNHACILMSENPVHRERTKHIDIRIHSLREKVQLGEVRLVPCPTAHMTADALTKALPAPAFIKHRQTILGHTPFSAPPFPSDLTVPAHSVTYYLPIPVLESECLSL